MSTDYTTPASSPHGPSLSRGVYGAPEATTPAATTQALIHVVDSKFGAHLPLKSGAPDDQAPTKRVDKDSHTVTIVQTTSTSQVLQGREPSPVLVTVVTAPTVHASSSPAPATPTGHGQNLTVLAQL